MLATDNFLQQRIRTELLQAGLTYRALRKSYSRHLYSVIHEKEHIVAAVYGRHDGGSGILVGTDRRILFFDHKIAFTVCDEIGFDTVSGVKTAFTGPFASVTLHTKIGDYTLRFANHTCTQRFVKYIEQKRIEGVQSDSLTRDVGSAQDKVDVLARANRFGKRGQDFFGIT
jgi:hypothetical protein